MLVRRLREMRKVLHIITGLNTGGAEMMLYKLCAHKSADIDYRVISLTSIGPIGDRIKALGIEVESLDLSKSPVSLLKLFTLVKKIKAYSPDIVQTWLYHADLIGGIAAKVAGSKVYWNIRQASVNRKLNKWHTVLASRICGVLSFIPEKIISCTQTGIQEHAKIGYPTKKMHFIPNGFDTDKYKPRGERKNIILHVGRYAPLKDHKTFIKVAKLLHEDLPEYEFHMYGDGVDESNDLFKDLPDYIKPKGRHDHLEEIYPQAKLLISTSLSEGFSNTIGEAMSCGTPVVATDVGDSAIIVDDNEKVTDIRNIEDLKTKSLNTINATTSSETQLKIKNRFKIQDIVLQYENIYSN
jgi:glycosyltransferase involved in cell wall biosynthesis